MQQLVQVVIGLAVLACVTNQRYGQFSILNAHLFFSTLTQRTTIEANNSRMTEVGVNAVEASRIGNCHIAVISPSHCLGHGDLLFFGRIHVALAAHDQFSAFHGAITPDFRIVTVIANDQTDLHALRSIRYIGAVARIPSLDRYPRHDLAILLHDLALVVHQDQGVVRRLVGMLLVTLTCQREYAPHIRFAAGSRKYFSLFAGNGRRGFVHLFRVVHDAVCRILWKNHQVHAW